MSQALFVDDAAKFIFGLFVAILLMSIVEWGRLEYQERQDIKKIQNTVSGYGWGEVKIREAYGEDNDRPTWPCGVGLRGYLAEWRKNDKLLRAIICVGIEPSDYTFRILSPREQDK